jgi:hypothetical protein
VHNTGNYWIDVKNRRKFFLEVAKKFNFNPLVPENWYNISHDNILSCKVLSLSISQLSISIFQSLYHYCYLFYLLLHVSTLPTLSTSFYLFLPLSTSFYYLSYLSLSILLFLSLSVSISISISILAIYLIYLYLYRFLSHKNYN